MVGLILWMGLLLLAVYLVNRIDFNNYMMNKLGPERYLTFLDREQLVLEIIITGFAVGFALNFIRVAPPGMHTVSVVFSVVAMTCYLGLHYRKIVEQLWKIVKEPFSGLCNCDLKWRIIMRLRNIKVITERHYPHTWFVFTLFKPKGKVN